MNHDPANPPPAAPDLPPEYPHGLDPRALLEAVAAPTGGPGATPAPPPPDPEELAASFPQLDIGECLGRGGMGVVYRARQRSLDRVVALKLLAPERGHDPAFAERFAREAQALARLNHPNIVTIHDFGQAGGFYYLLMEFVDGVNLRQAMQAGRFTPEQALAIVPPVCEALHYAHTHGVVHRDIKPENLLLDKAGRIKIADFGIAKMLHADEADTGLAETQPAGTPRYMAPEQRDAGRRTDHRADIYSLGVVLYELLTGELPGARLEAPSRRVQIDVRLDEIVLRALESEPDRRYQTAVELRTRIEELGAASPAPPTASPPTVPATPTSPAGPQPAPDHVLRAGQATVTTPAALATAAGQFFHYRNNRRQLLLDATRLTLIDGHLKTVIPLAAIRDLSIGHYPRAVNPAGLDFIDLTYDEGGQTQRLLVSPYQGLFGAPADWNRHVHDWWSAIRDATVAATGQAPNVTPASQLGTPRSSPWLLIVMSLPVLAGVVLLLVMLDSPARLHIAGRPPSSGPGLIGVIVLTLAAFTPLFWPRRSVAASGSASWFTPAIGLGAVLFAVLVMLAGPGFFEVLILMALASLIVIGLKRRHRNRAGTAASSSPPTNTVLNATLFAMALVLTILFAGPHYAVLGSSHIMVWEVGLPGPWLTDMLQVFSGGRQQRIRDMNLDRPSFYCGFAALASWMLWIRMRSQGGGAAVFELVQPSMVPGGRPRVRWGTLAMVWIASASLSVIGLLLVCVLMRHVLGDFPAPAPLLVFAIFPVSLVLLLGVRRGLQQARREQSSRGDRCDSGRTTRSNGCLKIFLICLAIAAFMVAAMVSVYNASHSPAPAPPTPVEVEPPPPRPPAAPIPPEAAAAPAADPPPSQ